MASDNVYEQLDFLDQGEFLDGIAESADSFVVELLVPRVKMITSMGTVLHEALQDIENKLNVFLTTLESEGKVFGEIQHLDHFFDVTANMHHAAVCVQYFESSSVEQN